MIEFLKKILIVISVILFASCNRQTPRIVEEPLIHDETFDVLDISLSIETHCHFEDLPRFKTLQFWYDEDLLNVGINLSTTLEEGILNEKVLVFTDEYEIEYEGKVSSEVNNLVAKVPSSHSFGLGNPLGIGRVRRVGVGFILQHAFKPYSMLDIDKNINYITFYTDEKDQELFIESKELIFDVHTNDCYFSISIPSDKLNLLKKWIVQKKPISD